MAVRTRANYKATKNSSFANNTTGDIGADDSRNLFEDTADSAVWWEDDVIDDDTMATASANTVPTSESVKAYVDSITGAALLQATVTISSAEILALNSTPKQLVAAPGSGKFIEVHKVWAYYNFATAAYATNTTLLVEYGSAQPILSLTPIIDQTSSRIYTSSSGGSSSINTLANVENISVRARVSSGNPTAGGGSVKINILYRIITF